MKKKFVVSFADIRYQHNLVRFQLQAESMKYYDGILIYNQFDLAPWFLEKFKEKLRPKAGRGFGYWSWKPQVILQAFDQMEDGDLLQYTDAGCHLNKKGIKRLDEYFEMVDQSEKGMLIFQSIRPKSPLDDGRMLPEWTDSMWTKGDVLDYFQVRDRSDIIDTPTIGAGIIFFKKCESTVSFVKKWLSIIEENFCLIDDTPSKTPNLHNFIDHRHDQSLFSILCKLNGIDTAVSAFEYAIPMNYNPNTKKFISDWAALENYPILAMRDIKKINTR